MLKLKDDVVLLFEGEGADGIYVKLAGEMDVCLSVEEGVDSLLLGQVASLIVCIGFYDKVMDTSCQERT